MGRPAEPAQPMADHHGEAEAWRVARTGGSRDERDLPPDQRAGAEGNPDGIAVLQGALPLEASVPAPRSEGTIRSAPAVLDADSRADGDGRPRAPDRLRERRQPASRARRRAAEGSGDSHGARREPRRRRPSTPGRKPRPGGHGRRARHRGRVVDRLAPAQNIALRRSVAHALGHSRRSRRRVRAAGLGPHRRAVRAGAGAAVDASRAHVHVEGRSRQRRRRHGSRAIPQRTRRRAGRIVGAAARRRHAVRAQSLQPEDAQPGVRGGSAARLLSRSVAERIFARAIDRLVSAIAGAVVAIARCALRDRVGDPVDDRQQLEQHGHSGGLSAEGRRRHEPRRQCGRAGLLRDARTAAC